MYTRSWLFTALALGMMCKCAPALANEEPSQEQLGAGIHDVTDPELASMRGRYVVGNDAVLYFGVEMISTWQTATGQTLQGTLTIGMNFSKNPNSPQVTYVPTVTITTPDAPLPNAANAQSSVSRSIQSGGIANVGGLVQSVQIAGDNNAVANVTHLNIQSGGGMPAISTNANSTTSVTSPSITGSSDASLGSNGSSPSVASASVSTNGSMTNTDSSTTTITPTGNNTNGSNSGTSNNVAAENSVTPDTTTNNGNSTPGGRTVTAGGSSVTATYANSSAQVTESVNGQGSTSQWIHPGSLGQTIQLAADNSVVTNQMIVTLVTQQLSGTEQLAHTLAQSLNLSHLNGH